METAVFNALRLKLEGEFNSLDVDLRPGRLIYDSSDGSQGCSYFFEMTDEGTGIYHSSGEDETSWLVPGTMVLWLYASGYKDWDEARASLGNVVPTNPGEVYIPANRMFDAVKRMVDAEVKSLGLGLELAQHYLGCLDDQHSYMEKLARERDSLQQSLDKLSSATPDEVPFDESSGMDFVAYNCIYFEAFAPGGDDPSSEFKLEFEGDPVKFSEALLDAVIWIRNWWKVNPGGRIMVKFD